MKNIRLISDLIQYHENEVIDKNTRRRLVEIYSECDKRRFESILGQIKENSALYAYCIDTFRFNFFDYLAQICIADHIVKQKPIYLYENVIDEYFGYFNDAYGNNTYGNEEITRKDFEYIFDRTITGFLIDIRDECERLSIFDSNKIHKQIKKYFK